MLRLGEKVQSAADRKSTRLNSSHLGISYAVFCLKKKNPVGELKKLLEARESLYLQSDHTVSTDKMTLSQVVDDIVALVFFLMIRRPPRSTLFSLHDALPIFHDRIEAQLRVRRHRRAELNTVAVAGDD